MFYEKVFLKYDEEIYKLKKEAETNKLDSITKNNALEILVNELQETQGKLNAKLELSADVTLCMLNREKMHLSTMKVLSLQIDTIIKAKFEDRILYLEKMEIRMEGLEKKLQATEKYLDDILNKYP